MRLFWMANSVLAPKYDLEWAYLFFKKKMLPLLLLVH